MRKKILLLIPIFIVCFFVYKFFSIEKVTPEKTSEIAQLISQTAENLNVGESKEVNIKSTINSTYDKILIVPPYYPENKLKSMIDANLAKSIAKSIPLNERFHLFIINEDQIQRNIELNEKFATKGNQLLILTSSENLLVTKIGQSDHHWFEITK
jgi:hypothetical protein